MLCVYVYVVISSRGVGVVLRGSSFLLLEMLNEQCNVHVTSQDETELTARVVPSAAAKPIASASGATLDADDDAIADPSVPDGTSADELHGSVVDIGAGVMPSRAVPLFVLPVATAPPRQGINTAVFGFSQTTPRPYNAPAPERYAATEERRQLVIRRGSMGFGMPYLADPMQVQRNPSVGTSIARTSGMNASDTVIMQTYPEPVYAAGGMSAQGDEVKWGVMPPEVPAEAHLLPSSVWEKGANAPPKPDESVEIRSIVEAEPQEEGASSASGPQKRKRAVPNAKQIGGGAGRFKVAIPGVTTNAMPDVPQGPVSAMPDSNTAYNFALLSDHCLAKPRQEKVQV